MLNEIQVITQLPSNLQWVNRVITIIIVVLELIAFLDVILISYILKQLTGMK